MFLMLLEKMKLELLNCPEINKYRIPNDYLSFNKVTVQCLAVLSIAGTHLRNLGWGWGWGWGGWGGVGSGWGDVLGAAKILPVPVLHFYVRKISVSRSN